MDKKDTIVICIFGEGELCEFTCPRIKTCWPEWVINEQKEE